MGLFSFVGSLCSSIGSAISSVVSGIGSALSSFVGSVAPVIAGVIDAIKPVGEALGRFANTFLQALGILRPNETVQEMGERALQATERGIKLEMFENFDQYMDSLRKSDLDPERAARRNPSEKLIAGLGLGTVGVEDKFGAERGSLNALWLLPMVNPNYFTPERMQSLVATGRLGGDIHAYLEQRLAAHDARGLEKQLETGLFGAAISPEQRSELYQNLDSSQAKWSELSQKAHDIHAQQRQQGAGGQA